jgi:hypothetical protein
MPNSRQCWQGREQSSQNVALSRPSLHTLLCNGLYARQVASDRLGSEPCLSQAPAN